jgi:hypothetical protein
LLVTQLAIALNHQLRQNLRQATRCGGLKMSNADVPRESDAPKGPTQAVSGPLQPHPLTSVMQMAITFCSLCIAAAAITYAIKASSEERNARLVEIGVGVLRVNPTKDVQVAAARGWALDLIDANSGGVKFSKEARQNLLEQRFEWLPTVSGGTSWGGADASLDTGSGGDDLSRKRPSKAR